MHFSPVFAGYVGVHSVLGIVHFLKYISCTWHFKKLAELSSSVDCYHEEFVVIFFVRLVVIQNFSLISVFSTAALLYIKPACIGVCTLFSPTFRCALF